MRLSRKTFVKKVCSASACLCGFTSLARATALTTTTKDQENGDTNKVLMQDWISTLLQSIDKEEDESVCKKIMKQCAISHYRHLQMDKFLAPYEGDLEKFNSYIEQQWGWKIDYRKEEKLLIADENKNHCVCPMVNAEKGIRSSILCYCSEGFAELMFSKVTGRPVKATVISSVLRGDASCKYRIKIP